MSYVIFILKSIALVFAFRGITSIISGIIDPFITPSKNLLIYGAMLLYTYLYGFFVAIGMSWMNNFESGINWKLALIFFFSVGIFWVLREQDYEDNKHKTAVYKIDNEYFKSKRDSGIHRMMTSVLLLYIPLFYFIPFVPDFFYGNVPNNIVTSVFPIF